MGLLSGLLLGCSSPATQNRRGYDRYAELVVERNRAQLAAKKAAARKNKSSRLESDGKDSLNRVPINSSSKAKKTVTPKKPVAKKRKPSPSKASVSTKPVPAPPVQVMTPAPVTPAPVKAAPILAPVSGSIQPAGNIGGYSLKIGDGIQVFLRGIPAPDMIEDIIDEVGMISLPLINNVQAAGLTSSELERSIRQVYLDKDIYRNISVNVVVPTRYFFIQGEVRAPGRFQILSATRVSQAIAGAGGYSEYASGKVLIKRRGKIYKTIRNARRLERTPADDILLEPDDIIEVRRSMW